MTDVQLLVIVIAGVSLAISFLALGLLVGLFATMNIATDKKWRVVWDYYTNWISETKQDLDRAEQMARQANHRERKRMGEEFEEEEKQPPKNLSDLKFDQMEIDREEGLIDFDDVLDGE